MDIFKRKKPKVAFFSFTCCEGCQLMVLSCEDELPDLVELADIVNFREAKTERTEDYEIAFVEGSITRPKEIEELRKIRAKASVVVAFGACSTMGGLNCLKNRFPMEQVKNEVYGPEADKYELLDTIPTRPIDSVINVDYYVHGCPIPKEEFLEVFTSLVLGKRPNIPNYPVCVDCKMAGNICVFEKGQHCVGPVTRAGCKAVCVTYGGICWGCRGFVDDPNIDAHSDTLERYGLSVDDVVRSLDLYGVCKLEEKTKG
jgi:coenzyme F420-reducing hydrogenase gamma subunit